MRFDGRVAVITGAGGETSLGRAYALLLASRGAKILVNDFGVGTDGRATRRPRAELVAQEIVDAGGEAIADANSVAEEDSARAIVQAAVDRWGRVDILINNAGIDVVAPFKRNFTDDIRLIVDVDLYGHIWMCRAVWPLMEAAGYGRIVNIGSDAMLGLWYQAVYGAARAGVFGLTRGLALEGEPHDIKVNIVGPRAATGASTMMTEEEELKKRRGGAIPELVAPAVAFLAHEDCPVTGKYFEVHAGRVRERFMSQTLGIKKPALTIEDVRDNLADVLDTSTGIPLPVEHRFATGARYSEDALTRYSAPTLEPA
jgi:NAD(P)-dependent dehydrogenase (short-subunit alcohol dehydrogenase family)